MINDQISVTVKKCTVNKSNTACSIIKKLASSLSLILLQYAGILTQWLGSQHPVDVSYYSWQLQAQWSPLSHSSAKYSLSFNCRSHIKHIGKMQFLNITATGIYINHWALEGNWEYILNNTMSCQSAPHEPKSKQHKNRAVFNSLSLTTHCLWMMAGGQSQAFALPGPVS